MAEQYSRACCSIPAVVSNYKPKGEMIDLAPNMPTYVVGPRDAKHAVLVLYDIFGFHNNTKQFSDILAECGNYLVVVPDLLYEGGACPYTMSDFHVEERRNQVFEFIRQKGTATALLPKTTIVREWLQTQGAAKAGIVGFCWGAKVGIQLTNKDPFYATASLIHPSFLDNKDAEDAVSPILSILSKDEPDLTEFTAILAKKPFGNMCSNHRFNDMHHGFAASRGDYDDPENRKRATEAIQLTVEFFKNTL
ncbi:dienelactone hydrolase [Dichotomocladium elegans]|nr:dienelactone hydrolase [Dichotomocladium elegans]